MDFGRKDLKTDTFTIKSVDRGGGGEGPTCIYHFHHVVREAAKKVLLLVDSPLRPIPPPSAYWTEEICFAIILLKEPYLSKY